MAVLGRGTVDVGFTAINQLCSVRLSGMSGRYGGIYREPDRELLLLSKYMRIPVWDTCLFVVLLPLRLTSDSIYCLHTVPSLHLFGYL